MKVEGQSLKGRLKADGLLAEVCGILYAEMTANSIIDFQGNKDSNHEYVYLCPGLGIGSMKLSYALLVKPRKFKVLQFRDPLASEFLRERFLSHFLC